ncbi:MAG: ATP-dependent DNA helicase [Verrucomicrobiota bacterium]
MNFTQSQLDAINHTAGNLQLIACAGSGKTEVVARRVATLLKAGDKPANVIAFTFTDKAAAELKERIITRCREELGELHGMAEMYVGTIHAFCLELLKSEVPKYLKYDVLSEIQQGLFIDRFSSKSGLTTSTDLNGNPLKRFVDTYHYSTATSILREDEPIAKGLVGCTVVKGLAEYRALLEQQRYFDYTAIIEAAVKALTSDAALRARLAKRIQHVIVDEYQDVNPIQEAIVRALHDLGAKICVVGDDDQTIYQWRGSNVKAILSFSQRYSNVAQVKLEENFRSSIGIVETARAFIEQNANRLPKQMKPTAAQTYEEGDIVAQSFDRPESEAQYIAETVQALHGVAIKEPTKGDPEHKRGIAYSDMAVLLRSVAKNAEPITRAFDHAGIPYIIVGMNNLFGTPEAEAARQLFYFMAARPGLDATSLATLWLDAGLGLKKADVQKAIQQARALRDEFHASNLRNVRYGLQRVFLAFLEAAGVREDRVPNHRGEIAFYNLGKFTQVITDYETINYHTKPVDLYEGFGNFLEHQVEDAYPEGTQSNQYANPDAVRIMTIHKAKGMQWPVVFIPALLKNRFPSAKIGGRGVWHLIPKAAIQEQARYEGSLEDERRLFYVAVTRSQKFLHLTWAPIAGKNNRYANRSEFWDDVLASKYVKRKVQDYATRLHLKATPRQGVSNVVFTFSDLKYLFECPYQFKLRVLYGFNPPIREELGFGRSLHNALAEVHARAINGDHANDADASNLVGTHLHVPFANPALKARMEASAEKIVRNYINDNQKDFDKIEFSEKQIDISLTDGVSVIGRIDLVRRKDTNETTIVDLKSNDRAQPEEVTEHQLHIYALGYEELTGKSADYVEIYELDERKRKPRSVDNDFIVDVKKKVAGAAQMLRQNLLPAVAAKTKCTGCDYRGMCSSGATACAT